MFLTIERKYSNSECVVNFSTGFAFVYNEQLFNNEQRQVFIVPLNDRFDIGPVIHTLTDRFNDKKYLQLDSVLRFYEIKSMTRYLSPNLEYRFFNE